ncbi:MULTISPECIES: adenosine kinase [unclassified Roseofilum]|uniref:adenosine kinase n=1 Tax=unclassified Roseofilum TaxID=2620099 RepID=UPI000E8AA7F9|nr:MULTISPECIES: adenosine kinase [unclassified Roseofilum]MBP0010639.1 adenosine kinase [Roseofilum sp. Belize Diploria]MBP0034566.1 adenosine kinase [Roseofilum sp. Belize BBD 4]HBQ98058.1 adenosine kinase [Cyanobacteria bacterium UBA11691]
MSNQLDVFGVGNALVDVLALVDDSFITEQALERGVMTLVDAEAQGKILGGLQRDSLKLRSGGSAANTMIAIAQSGGTGFYTGKVAQDENGEFYAQDMKAAGIEFEVTPAPIENGPTGTCVVLTTPDAERTMCTNLGASTTLSPSDIDVEKLKRCQYSYVEGYLWTGDDTRKASIETMEQSKRHGVKVSFTLSDPFLLHSFRDDFRNVVTDYCDVLFCNADEVRQFLDLKDLEACAQKVGELVNLAFITDSDKGCLVVENKQIITVEGFPVKPLDTVGAGDAFAGGALYGLTHGYSAPQAARWGNYLGSAIVQIQGPRLEKAPVDQMASILGA